MYTIIALIVIGGGVIRTSLTFIIDYNGLSAERVYFAGSGIALIMIGLFNYIVIRTHAKDKIINITAYGINALGIVFLALAGIVLKGESQPILLILVLIPACILTLKMGKLNEIEYQVGEVV